MGDPQQVRIDRAIDFAVRYGGIDGDHHKAWVIDQMVRALTGCPLIYGQGKDVNGQEFQYETQGESAEYQLLVRQSCAGDDGPDTYEWNQGIAP